MRSKFATAIIVAAHVILVAFSTYANDNSWTAASGKWETGSNWSLGVAPSSGDDFESITNDGSKIVTIDGTTAGGFPGTMTVNALYLSDGAGATNTLFLNNAGLGTPLHSLSEFSVGVGAVCW